MVEKLNYLRVTHLNGAYGASSSVNYAVSYYSSLGNLGHILYYLKRASGRGILYANHNNTCNECFSDSNWVSSKIDRRWQVNVYFVGGKLGFMEQSIELWHKARETMLLFHMLNEMSFEASIHAKLWCDNQIAFHIVFYSFHEQNSTYWDRLSFCSCQSKRMVDCYGYLKNEDHMGDLLMKALTSVRMDCLCYKLNVINIYDQTWGGVLKYIVKIF